MAGIEFKKETIMSYADDFMKKLSAGERLITPEKLAHANKVGAGLSVDLTKHMFFKQVGKFLENFANNEREFLQRNADLLTPENLKKVTEEIVKRGDKDKSGTIDFTESKTLMTGLDPKQLLIQVSGQSNLALK
jgi:hypothetical protein